MKEVITQRNIYFNVSEYERLIISTECDIIYLKISHISL